MQPTSAVAVAGLTDGPVVTFRDDATGERVDVTGADLGSWAARTASLFSMRRFFARPAAALLRRTSLGISRRRRGQIEIVCDSSAFRPENVPLASEILDMGRTRITAQVHRELEVLKNDPTAAPLVELLFPHGRLHGEIDELCAHPTMASAVDRYVCLLRKTELLRQVNGFVTVHGRRPAEQHEARAPETSEVATFRRAPDWTTARRQVF